MNTALERGGDRTGGVWNVNFGSSVYAVHMRGYFGDGPHCTCPNPESNICLHILIVILGAAYTNLELVNFGFAGSETSLNDILFKTFRGLGPEAQEESKDDGVESFVQAGDNSQDVPDLDLSEQNKFISVLETLRGVFALWFALKSRTRERLEGTMWQRFRLGLGQNHLVRRTRLGARVGGTGRGLPRKHTAFAGRRKQHGAQRMHSTVLRTLLVEQTLFRAPDVKQRAFPTTVDEIKKSDTVMARACIDKWRNGRDDLAALSKEQLRIVCKGLGLNISGNMTVLRERITGCPN